MAEDEKVAESSRSGRLRIIAIVLIAIIIVVGIFWWRSRGHESTDDAQIDGHITQISARVPGTVVTVKVDNNQFVTAGTVIVQLDQRDYQVALERAKAELADAQATAIAARTGVPIAQVETRSGVSTASGGVQEAEAAVSARNSRSKPRARTSSRRRRTSGSAKPPLPRRARTSSV
jgi:membrane fusion protein (multidrug efflux system)